ncbi:immunoglobulin superfamily member 11-like [Oncorhynchus clarkii lewisi]|uniref:immunoglobulin superfamily member 11-like n=1 Tax=Oncorhynchus clarkii lewisi TaxID=490388 RepID=UPI0039B979FB
MKMHGIDRDRHVIHLHCLWIVGFVGCVASSSLPSGPLSISSPVGSQAILPCKWKSQLDNVPVCHVLWQTPDAPVFEQNGEQRWQASEFEGRLEVPGEKLWEGDCSLILRDVQFGDVGLYESFMVVDRTRRKRRVFIQSVHLSVYDHKSKLSMGMGEDLVLTLHTPQAMRVVFQGRNSTEWKVLWMRGDGKVNGGRLEEAEGLVVLRGLRMDNSGTYKVLDSHGLSVSTVKLTVEEVAKTQKIIHIQDKPVGKSTVYRSSSLLIVFVLLISPLIQHLL